ncbi:MAG TPA: class I SAM-dependent methyltransferase [Kofleriaceae bacterium]
MLAFHAAHPGVTARGFARGTSYEFLAAQISHDARVLDLACGNGPLLALCGENVVGIDLSLPELLGTERTAVARAQQLPFANASFDVVACHLAFMLFDDIEQVVAELGRVLIPGGELVAIMGGGPTAEGRDAFHRFLELSGNRTIPPLGDPRAKSERGWADLFTDWTIDPWQRHPIDLSGSFEDVWTFLASAYEADPGLRDQLRAEFPTDPVPCTAVTYVARARSPRTRSAPSTSSRP